MEIIIIISLLSLFVLIGYLIIRNEQVFKIYMKLNKDIYKYNKKCIKNNTYNEKLMYPFELNVYPTYDQMVYRFWIPVKKLEKKLRKNIGLEDG